MTISVQMCGFEASRRADLRADFGVFADTKYRELPGACKGGGSVFLTPTVPVPSAGVGGLPMGLFDQIYISTTLFNTTTPPE